MKGRARRAGGERGATRCSSGGAAAEAQRSLCAGWSSRTIDEETSKRENENKAERALGVFQRHAFDQVVFVFGPAAAWPRSVACRLLSAVARTQRTVRRPTARGPRDSRLAPVDPDRGGKLRTALCWLMCSFLCPLAGWEQKNALWSMAPAWYGSVRSVLCQFYVSSMSVLCQFYVSSMSVLCQFYVSSMSVLCQFYVSSMFVVMPHASPPSARHARALAAPCAVRARVLLIWRSVLPQSTRHGYCLRPLRWPAILSTMGLTLHPPPRAPTNG